MSLLCQMGVIFTRVGIVFLLESWAATIKVTCDLAVATVNVNHDVPALLFFSSKTWSLRKVSPQVVKLSLTPRLRWNWRTQKFIPALHSTRRYDSIFVVLRNFKARVLIFSAKIQISNLTSFHQKSNFWTRIWSFWCWFLVGKWDILTIFNHCV